MLAQGPQGGPVRVPLLALAEEEAVEMLAVGVGAQHLGGLVVQSVAIEGGEHVGRVPEPEAVVGGRPGRDVGPVVQQQQEATVGLDRRGHAAVGKLESQAPPALDGPGPGHRARRRQGGRQLGHALHPPAGQPAPAGPALGHQGDGHPQGRPVGEREQKGGLGQAGVAPQSVGKRRARPAAGHELDGVAVVERRPRHAGGRLREEQGGPAVDGDGPVDQLDALDDGQPLGVVRAHRQGEGERDAGSVLELDDDELFLLLHGVDAFDGITSGDAHDRLHDGGIVDQALAHAHFAGGKVPAVVGAHPPVERPPVEPGCHQPALVDHRLPRRRHVAHHRPVALGQVCEERQVPSGHERRGARVELTLEPVRPHPVDPELGRGAGPQRPQHCAGAYREDLGGQLDLDGLAQALERRQVSDDVVADAQAPHGPPQQPCSYAHPRYLGAEIPCSSGLVSRCMRAGTMALACLPS